MSTEQYENMQHDDEIYAKLKEAEFEANHSDVRYSHAEVFGELRQQMIDKMKGKLL